jgi:two-component sensor histidine kinase
MIDLILKDSARWRMVSEDESPRRAPTYESAQELLAQCPGLSAEDRDRLGKVARDLPFVADISRSDLLLYVPCTDQEALLVAHARPHSIMPVYPDDITGYRPSAEDEGVLFRALRWGRPVMGARRMIDGGAPAIQKVWPIRGHGGRIVAAVNVEANLIAQVRHRSRSKVFQWAVTQLQRMLVLGELQECDALSPFMEHDGILVVDSQRMIRYASGIATEHYRKLGYMDSLVGRDLASLNTSDRTIFAQVLRSGECYEREDIEYPYLRGDRSRVWIRKAVPLLGLELGKPWWRPWTWFHRRLVGVLITVQDATEERRKERELKVKSAMIQEVHHRVKNNLQTVAAMLRMQIRRASDEDVRQILQDTVNRIFSMAVVHEYLSREEGQAINIREVTLRIMQQTQQSLLSPEKRIQLRLENGNNLYLPARQATACALVINELVQNAVEHGYKDRTVGTVSVGLEDEGDHVCIRIADDGKGLPPDFDVGQSESLGLQIVRTLVQDDLRGTIEIKDAGGVLATVRFSKTVLEGEEHWNA